MSAEGSQAKCRNCGYTEDCNDVKSSGEYECEYCGEDNWNMTECS